MANRISHSMAVAAEGVLELLWPTRCALCDAHGRCLCDHCLEKLPYIDANRSCPRCGAPWGRIQCCECNDVMLASMGRTEPPFDAMVCALHCTDEAKRLVTTYKDRGERRLVQDMARIMVRAVPPSWKQQIQGVAFVPATAKARRRRGFDHGQELGEAVAALMNASCLPLLAAGPSADQRSLGRRERKANMDRRMSVLAGATVPPTLLVTDDICTTGATLGAACDALRAAGAKHLYCLTLARV